MRFLTFLALLGFALLGEAHAAPPTCWPSNIGGTGGPATYTIANKTGPAAGWHCPDNTEWLYAVRWGDVTPAMGRAMEAVLSSADRQAAATALLPFATVPLAQVFEVWQQFATWKPVVAEGQTIKVTGPVVLRFGVDTRWVIKTNVWSDIACTNAAFTVDPAPGVVKGCEVALFVGQPIPVAASGWKVKRNAQSTTTPTTRPVYILSADGASLVITTKPAERVPEGLPCDAPLKASGADGYGVPQGFAAPKVALCSK